MVHQYKLGGYNIVLDVCSGAVHVVDEVAYDIIAMFETADKAAILAAMAEKYADREDISREDIAECYAQVVALKEAGKLFAIPAREQIGRANSVPVEEYPRVYERIEAEMEMQIAEIAAMGGEL